MITVFNYAFQSAQMGEATEVISPNKIIPLTRNRTFMENPAHEVLTSEEKETAGADPRRAENFEKRNDS